MSGADRAVARLARFIVHIVVFALLGPAVGAMIFVSTLVFGSLLATGLETGVPREWAVDGWGWVAAFLVAMSYAVGTLPAAAVGAVLGLVSAIASRMARVWETVLAAIVVPGVILWLVLEPLASESATDDALFAFLLGLSPIAAIVCRLVVGTIVGAFTRGALP